MVKTRFENLEELKEHEVFKNFYKISQIPHPSHHEDKLSNFLLKWGKEKGLEVYQDEFYNLLIRKPATKEYENLKPVILQAHLDMVCEKAPEIEHDFYKDPIKWVLEDDILSTGNTTTLGSDNGIGVAMIMSILESENLKHPPIDALLTTAEEEDMSGALNVDKSWFNTNRIINLDNSNDTELIVGSAGGMGVRLKYNLDYINIPEDFKLYEINVSGLKGGHSGGDIHKGLGNANIILGRILNRILNKVSISIGDLNGGDFRLAIPREASSVIAFSKKDEGIIKEEFRAISEDIKKEYENEKNLDIEINESNYNNKIITESLTEKIINTILLSPNGIQKMNGSLNMVDSSSNLGEISTDLDKKEIEFIYEIRGSLDSSFDYTYDKIKIIGSIFKGQVEYFSRYPGWAYKPSSKLRELTVKTYKELYNKDMKVLSLHVGLECGCFEDKVEDIEAISLGPNAWHAHSPSESLSVSSTINFYEMLKKILENIDF